MMNDLQCIHFLCTPHCFQENNQMQTQILKNEDMTVNLSMLTHDDVII
jgi:hypothetical protein